MTFVKPRSGNASDGEIYVLDSVNESLRGNGASSVDRALRSGNLSLEDVDPDFDFRLERGSDEPDIESFTDVHQILDVIETSYIDSVEADVDKGFFRARTNGNEQFDVWMPYLDEGKAAGIFHIENPWTGQRNIVGYNGLETTGSEIDAAKPVLDAAYRTAREAVPECGIRVQGWNIGEFKSKAHEFIDKSGDDDHGIIGKIEREGLYSVDATEHSGGAREKKIIQNLDESLSMFNLARLVDYRTKMEYGKGEIHLKGGGYKSLTQIPENAPYENHKEAIEYRLPEKWK